MRPASAGLYVSLNGSTWSRRGRYRRRTGVGRVSHMFVRSAAFIRTGMKSSPRRWPRAPSGRGALAELRDGVDADVAAADGDGRFFAAVLVGELAARVVRPDGGRRVVGGEDGDQLGIGRQVAPVGLHPGVERLDGVADAEGLVVVRHRVGVLRVEVDELVALVRTAPGRGSGAAAGRLRGRRPRFPRGGSQARA